ncbi:MAG: hypothetical protein WBW31_09915 [Candidatus Sulfotelmatobacter sp.]
MASEPHLRWNFRDYEPDYEPDIRDEDGGQARDPVVDQAKDKIRVFFGEERASVFYKQQLEVIFEADYFHWVTSRALSELAAEGHIAVEREVLPGTGNITFYHAISHRYWRRQAQEVIALVERFSAPAFTAGLGAQGELMVDAALPSVGFLPTARKVRSYGGKDWKATEHDLDRIYERDGIAYGAEIKNTLKYIPRNELTVKLKMCRHLGLRPLFIVRMAAKSYIEEVRLEGGFTLVFKFQLYPFGQKPFADTVRESLRLPVDCPARIAEGTVQRFLKWHLKTIEET